ncbi:MAG: tetratricopeptide repeat protein [Planctomycetes bacterium]|nr:tetratricopeptide repeat protein [Planctomycetota bacterium]
MRKCMTIHRRLAASVLSTPTLLAAPLVGGCTGSERQSRMSYSSGAVPSSNSEDAAGRPPTAKTLYRMAKILAAQDKLVHSETVLRTTIKRYPKFMPAHCELARVFVAQRKIAAAAQTLQHALQINPNDPVLLNDLGMCWMLIGAYEDALAAFSEAADAAPHDARYKASMAPGNRSARPVRAGIGIVPASPSTESRSS